VLLRKYHAAETVAVSPDEGFTYEFTTAGKYEYLCTVHPRMAGTIIVDGKSRITTHAPWDRDSITATSCASASFVW
jgi:hypothetical protein